MSLELTSILTFLLFFFMYLTFNGSAWVLEYRLYPSCLSNLFMWTKKIVLLKPVDSAKVAAGRQLDCFRELLENPPDTFNSVSQLLLRIASNIVKEPRQPKYRTLKLNTNTFQNKLLPVKGAVECLFAMGFEEVSTSLPVCIRGVTIHRPIDASR